MPWLHKRAGQMRPPSWMWHDDLVQEGLLAMWKALQTWDSSRGQLPSWLTMKATLRMIEVLDHQLLWTGRPSRHNGRHPMNLEEQDVSYDTEMHDRAVPFDEPLMSYHRDEIIRALLALSPAKMQYVVLRFIKGLSNAEIVDIIGYDGHTLWTSRGRGAKWELQRTLGHLRP